jgi:hypothetical protein
MSTPLISFCYAAAKSPALSVKKGIGPVAYKCFYIINFAPTISIACSGHQ